MEHYFDLYPRWVGMMAKGVVKEWTVFSEFHAWAAENHLTDECRLVRIDPTKPYGPKNCVVVGYVAPPQKKALPEVTAPETAAPAEKQIQLPACLNFEKSPCDDCGNRCCSGKGCEKWSIWFCKRFDDINAYLRSALPAEENEAAMGW